MTAKKIRDYLPEKQAKMKLVQTTIEADLYEEVCRIKKREHISWRELIVACFQKYLDEAGEKKAG